MGAVKDAYIAAEEHLHALIALLEEEGHALAGEFRRVYDLLHGQVPKAEAEPAVDGGIDVPAAAIPAATPIESAKA